MKSRRRGKSISKIEIQQVSPFGIWLLFRGREHFLDYKRFPWFKKAKPQDVKKVKLIHGAHLYWPKLDVDLDVVSIANPEQYPLVYQ